MESFDELPSLVYCHSIYLPGCFSSRHWGTLYQTPPSYILSSPPQPHPPSPAVSSSTLLHPPSPKHTYMHAIPPLNPMSFPIQFHPAFFSPSSVLDLCPNWFEAYSLTQMHAKFDSLHSVVLLSLLIRSPTLCLRSLNGSPSHGVTEHPQCPHEGCLSKRVAGLLWKSSDIFKVKIYIYVILFLKTL